MRLPASPLWPFSLSFLICKMVGGAGGQDPMLSQHCLQLVLDPQAEGEQGCLLCATLAGQSWPWLSPYRCLRVPGEEPEEEPKVKTQWPRSADEPGVYLAQTGNSGPPPSLCGGSPTVWRLVACVLGVCLSVSASWSSVASLCSVRPVGRAGLPPEGPVTWAQGRRIPKRPSACKVPPAADTVPLL